MCRRGDPKDGPRRGDDGDGDDLGDDAAADPQGSGDDGRDHPAGKVLPVGAIRDKVLAAHRAGIRCVVMPRENENDLLDVPEEVRRDLEIVLVEHVDEC